MATVLQFPPAQTTSAKASEIFETPAQILFFTGVRYERYEAKEIRKTVIEPILPLAL